MNIPSSLFRYTWLNPEFEKSFTNIFAKNEIYSPLVEKLNDPFDCTPQLDITNISDDEIKDGFFKTYKAANLSEREINERIKYINIVGAKKFVTYRFYTGIIPAFRKNRILSLSETPADFSMWVYYANFFQGFCMEIKPDEEWTACLVPVQYKQQPCKFNPKELFEPGFETKPFVTTKSEHWQHEKEWRIFNHYSNETEYVPLPREGIVCIYFGMKMSASDKDKIRNLCKVYKRSIVFKDQFINQSGKIDFR